MKVLKKALSALLVVVFLLGVFQTGIIPEVSAFTYYTDISGHWAAGVINRWNSLGFIDPEIFTGTQFLPNTHITRAEFFSLIINSLGATEKADISGFSDVYPDTWQYDIVAMASRMGIANGYPDDTMRPDDTLLRQDAATLAARAMGMTSLSDWNLSRFSDGAYISPYSKTYVAAFVEKRIMEGYPDGSFRPRAFLTRAEAVKILDNLFTNIYMPEIGFRNVYLQGGLLIQSPGAELRDVIIDGDVIVGDGVGNGNVVIAGCIINGRLIVRGGGPYSVTLSNTVVEKGMYVASFSAETHISVTDNSTVPVLEAVSGFSLSGSGVAALTILENANKNAIVNLNGVSLDELNINGPEAQVRLNSGHAMYVKFDDAGQGARLDIAANTTVGHLTISAPGAVVNGSGIIRNLLINNSGAIVAPTPEFMTIGLNIIATVGGISVSGTESQWANINIDRVSSGSNLKVQLLSNPGSKAPFDQSSLFLTMVAGSAAAEAHVSQSAANRVPLTQRNNRWAYWVGFFVPAPPEAANMASITYTYIDGEPITLPPRALDTYSGRLGLLIYLPVFREPSREAGLIKELLYINWGGALTENIHFMSSTMYLSSLNSSQKALLQNDFDKMIMYSIQGGALQYTGAEAVRRILASDNPLGLSSNSNRGLDALNRAVSSPEARSVLEDAQFARDLTIDTAGNSQYSALSNAGKQFVADQVLAARKTTYATPAAVKAAFNKAVQARLAAETSLLIQINSSGDAATLRRIIEITANAAILQFQTGADPYKSYTNAQKNTMAEHLFSLRQYRTIQEVIDAIKKYLSDPSNGSGGGSGEIDLNDVSIRRIVATVFPSTTVFATSNTREVTVSVELIDGAYLSAQHISQLINSGVITYQWGRGSPGSDRGPVAVVSGRSANVYTITCIHNGIGTQTERRDTLTFTLTDANGKRFTTAATFTAEEKRFATGISLPDKVLMLCGETQLVQATLTPNNANDVIRWSISPSAGIASIRPTSDGRCEIIANDNNINGIAALTATTEKGYSAECLVIVFRNANDVVADPSSIILTPGSYQDITTYTYSPNALLRWDLVDGQPDIVTYNQSGRITAPILNPQIYGDTAVTVSVTGSNPLMAATVKVTVKANTGVNISLERSIMYNGDRQELSLNVDDPELQGQRYYIKVAGGLGGDAARCVTAQPVRASDKIYIEADRTNVGEVTVSLYNNPAFSGNVIGNELTIIVSPKSVSNVEFHHTGTVRTPVVPNTEKSLIEETDYGHIVEMKLSETPTVTPLIPVAPGQSWELVPGYARMPQTMTWFPYECDYNREILRDVKTVIESGKYQIVDRNGDQIEFVFEDVFRLEEGTVGRAENGVDSGGNPVTYYWLRGYFKYGITTLVKSAVERDAHMIKLPSSTLNATNGQLRSRDTRLTGLAAVAISPSRGRLTDDQLQEWGDLFYNEVPLFVSSGRINPIIARQSGFTLQKLVGTQWEPADDYDLYDDANIRSLVNAGTHRAVDVNGEPLFGTSIPAIVVGDPNAQYNTFYVRVLPNDLPRPTSPWNSSMDWRAPTGAGDPGAVSLIPIVPGSNDKYDYLEPGVDRVMTYPHLTATLISTMNITPDNIGVTWLGASTYMVVMRMPFPSSPPRPSGTYTDYYIVQQYSKLGFARLYTDGADESNRQEPVTTPAYPNDASHLVYNLTLIAPELFTAIVTEGDTGNVVDLPGVNEAVINANISVFTTPTPEFISLNPAILSVNQATGYYTALQAGSVTLSITQGAKTAQVIIVVEPAYELVLGQDSSPLFSRPGVIEAAGKSGFSITNSTQYETSNAAIFTVNGAVSAIGNTAYATGVALGYADLRITDPGTPTQIAIVRIHVVSVPIGINPLMVGIDSQLGALSGIAPAAEAAGIDLSTANITSADPSKLEITPSGTVIPKAGGDAKVIVSSPDGSKSTTVTVEISPSATSGDPPASTTPVTPTTPSVPPPPAPAATVTDISLRAAAFVVTGKTTRLEPYVTPFNADRGTLKWSSSDSEIAIVAGGIVTGIKTGSAVITVTDDSGTIKSECAVTVKADSAPVASIAMRTRTLTLSVGASSTLSVTFRPTNPTIRGLTWVSDSSSVARVEPNGRVVGVSPGTATITAISDSGGKATTCVVTVKIPVASITLPETSVRLRAGETYQVNPIIIPADATVNTVTYSTSSVLVASVSASGIVTARKAGTATITARVDGKTATLRVTVTKN